MIWPNARLWGGGRLTRLEWAAARETLALRAQALRSRLEVLSIPAFDAATVRERWEDMSLAERRSIVAGAFERIEVRAATTTRYDPGRIALVWRNNEATPAGRTSSTPGCGLNP